MNKNREVQELEGEMLQTTKQNVSLHLNNLYKEGELQKEGTVKEYLTYKQCIERG